MRVAVDGLALGERRGIGNYLRHELAHLVDHADLDLHVLVPAGTTAPPGTTGHPTSRRLQASRFADREHDLRLPRDLARIEAEVVWCPGQHPPRWSRQPWVQTIHDLIPLVLDDPALRRDRRRWRRNVGRVRQASAILADSGHTADVVVDRLQIDRSKVQVVPLGLDARFRPPPADRDRSSEVGPNVLMVAPWAPYKGYTEAMAVLDHLVAAGFSHTLRIVGANDEWMSAQAEAQRLAAGHPDRVRLEGWVDDLREAYWDADVVVVTSRHEGFGLPLLEAMGSGAAVVSFDNSSLPEVAGDGAVLVPDGDVDAMAATVGDLLRDEAARRELGRRGVARAAAFTWEDSAAAIADVLRAVAGRVRT